MSLGLMAFVPTLPIYMRERFGIEDPDELRTWAGLVFGAAPLAAAICGPFWGALGDRVGRKLMALRAIAGIAAVTALMPLASTPGWLLALRLLQGSLAGYIAPAMALVAASAPAERQGRTIGSLQVAAALGLLFGPAVGAEVASAFGREAVFFVTSGAAVIGGLSVLLFAREGDAPHTDRRSPVAVWKTLGGLLRSRVVAALFLSVFLTRFGLLMTEAYLALVVEALGPLELAAVGARSDSHALDRTTALMFSVYAVAQILLTGWWGRLGDRVGPLRCLAASSLALAVVVFATGFVTSIGAFLTLRCTAAVFMAGGVTLAYAAIGKRIRVERKALAFASVQSCMQLGMCAGPIVGSLVARVSGLPGLFQVSGVALLLAAVVMFAVRGAERTG